MNKPKTTPPSMLDALIPIIFLVGLLSLAVYLFGDDASWGPNQLALTFSSLIAAVIALKNGHTWKNISDGVVRSISQAMGAIFILLAVGALIGTWVMSGTVTTMIYYGLKLLNPTIFFPTTIIVTAIISASIGSSWTTVGTIGIGLMGIAHGMDLSVGMTAGAIISGSYFGDKLSPLSDTTNLAPAVSGTDLYSHIKHMLWTTIPSMAITLIMFTIIGFMTDVVANSEMMNQSLEVIKANFNTEWYLLTPIFVVLILAVKKMPPFPTILIGALVGGLFAVFFQTEQVVQFVDRPDLSHPMVMIAGVWKAMYGGFTTSTGTEAFDQLVNRGGMQGMLDVIWLILSALMYGGVMEEGELLKRLVQSLLKMVHGTGSLIATTVFTCIGTNVITSDQYMSIVLPGRMYKLEYERRKLAPENLSRTLEDSGTITSPLIPWNTCGAYMSGTLGVATFTYLPFAFFNIINPILAILYGYLGIGIKKIETEKEKKSEK